MRLALTRHAGPRDAPPLVIAHGLFGSGRNWGVLARRLAEGREVLAVDMRNHGASDWADDHGYGPMAADLAETIAAETDGPVDLLGHSMGGKAAMMLALAGDAPLRRLVVADIAPVAYGHSQMDLVRAMQALDLSGISTRAEADAALAPAVPEAQVRAFLLQSLDVRAKAWRLNLDALAASMDEIVGWPDPLGRWDGPALFLRGGASGYVTDAHRAGIERLFPAARIELVEGAGHWLHAEAPRETEAAVAAFLG